MDQLTARSRGKPYRASDSIQVIGVSIIWLFKAWPVLLVLRSPSSLGGTNAISIRALIDAWPIAGPEKQK